MSVPADRPKSRSLGPLRALVPYLRPYRGVLVLALLALLVAAAAMLALPIALRYLIDNGISSKSSDTINQYFVAFLAAAAIFGVFAALRFYLVSWIGERVVADMRSAVYARVIRMDPAFFEVTRIGEVLSRLTADTTLVQSIAGVNLSITLRSTLSLIGSLVMLGVTSFKLTAILVVLIPVVIVPLIVLGRRVRRLSRTSQDRIADTSSIADETLNAVQTVQAFTLEQINTNRFDAAVEDSFGAAVRRTRTRSTLTALATMLVFGAITFVLWMGAHAVVRGEMTGGQLGQFLLYAGYVAIAAASLSEMWGEVQRAAGAMERLIELEHAQPTIQAPAQPVALPVPDYRAALTGDVRGLRIGIPAEYGATEGADPEDDAATAPVESIVATGRIRIHVPGVLIAQRIATQIFDPFPDCGNGHGLSLAVARRLIENQGGTAHVEADGTTLRYTIDLPLLEPSEPWAYPRTPQAPFVGSAGHPVRQSG